MFQSMEKHPSEIKPESWIVSAGRASEPGAPLNVPLVPASNFIIGGGREYSRDDGTPTWEALEEVVGGLESGVAVAFASGMAAIAAVFDQLAAGAVVVLPDDCYQGVAGLAAAGAERQHWSVQRLAVDDTAGWICACGAADLIWLESLSNPLLTVADVEAVCAAPRKPGAIVAVDRLGRHPLVTRVRYPGLPSHPTHATAKRVLEGFGSVISFDLLGGAEFADRVCRHVRLIRHATSLGAVESTMERRAAVPGQGHLPPSLLRISVGIEDADDLWNDLDSSIRSAAP